MPITIDMRQIEQSRFATIRLIILFGAVAAAVTAAMLGLQRFADRHEGARVALEVTRAEMAALSQLEWQATAERRVSDEVGERAAAARADAEAAVAGAAAALGNSPQIGAIDQELRRYLRLMDREFTLLATNRLEAAERLDTSRVDPQAEKLRGLIAAETAAAARRADRATLLTTIGSALMLLLGLIATSLLGSRLTTALGSVRRAWTDALTGLGNRLAVTDHLDRRLTRSGGAASVGVLFIDLDNFKRINDTYGHHVGDELLRSVASRIQECIRVGDVVGRLGGDEFAVVLDGLASESDLEETAARIGAAIAAPTRLSGHSFEITASIGCAPHCGGTASGDELLRKADLAMYAGKRQGRRRVVMYEPSMLEALADRVELETDLRHAVARNQITVVYQPVVEVGTGQLRSLEALARWQHPVRGTISPDLFIPLAEETGDILAIGGFVLREAVWQLRRWQDAPSADRSLGIAVNVSPAQLQDDAFVDEVATVLRESGIRPETLTLEITESVLVERGDTFLKTLHRLRSLDVNLAIDDFGTGYSSLASLTRFPVSTVKIDRAFVTELGGNEQGADIVRSIMDLSRSLGLSAVAEGIETEQQAEMLTGMECGYGQGFLYAEPLSAERVEALIAGQTVSERVPG